MLFESPESSPDVVNEAKKEEDVNEIITCENEDVPISILPESHNQGTHAGDCQNGESSRGKAEQMKQGNEADIDVTPTNTEEINEVKKDNEQGEAKTQNPSQVMSRCITVLIRVHALDDCVRIFAFLNNWVAGCRKY